MGRSTDINAAGGGIGWATAIVALVFVAILAAPAQAAPPDSTPASPKLAKLPAGPAGSGLYWGAWIGNQLTGEGAPWDMSAASAFEGIVGKRPSLLEFSGPFSTCDPDCVPYRFPTNEMNAVRGYGAIPIFSWGSQSNPGSLEQPGYQLSDVASGAFDSYIREFAESAKAWGHPFFLRFDWEMNGSWFTWGTGVNGNQRGELVPAWQHVHDIFTAVGATNATWVWCPYADATNRFGALKAYYPGDAYVDWTCLDGYNWAQNSVNPAPWRSFDQIFVASYRAIVEKIAPSKPMMLGEVASNGVGRAKAVWIRHMFKSLALKYPRIRALAWFDQIDRDLRWPIETSRASIKAFSRGVRNGHYRAGHYGSIAAEPIQAPG
jgi:hypothetical protein